MVDAVGAIVTNATVVKRSSIWKPDYNETVKRLSKFYGQGYTFELEAHEYEKQNWSWRGDGYWTTNETDYYLVISWDGTGLTPEQVEENLIQDKKDHMRNFLKKYNMVKDEDKLNEVLDKIYK